VEWCSREEPLPDNLEQPSFGQRKSALGPEHNRTDNVPTLLL